MRLFMEQALKEAKFDAFKRNEFIDSAKVSRESVAKLLERTPLFPTGAAEVASQLYRECHGHLCGIPIEVIDYIPDDEIWIYSNGKIDKITGLRTD